MHDFLYRVTAFTPEESRHHFEKGVGSVGKVCHLWMLGLQTWLFLCASLLLFIYTDSYTGMQNYLDPFFWQLSSPPVSFCTKIGWCRRDPAELPVKFHPPETRARCCDTLGMWEVLSSETSEHKAKSQFKCFNSKGFSSNSTSPLLKLWNRKALQLSEKSADPVSLPWLCTWKQSWCGSKQRSWGEWKAVLLLLDYFI